METIFFFLLLTTSCFSFVVESSDNNHMYSPCGDTKVERSDGFTFAIAFASRSSFFLNNSQQLSPCDRRLSLSSSTSQIAVFRPKVDEISLLTINTSSFSPVTYIFFNSLFVFLKFYFNLLYSYSHLKKKKLKIERPKYRLLLLQFYS